MYMLLGCWHLLKRACTSYYNVLVGPSGPDTVVAQYYYIYILYSDAVSDYIIYIYCILVV